MVRRTVTQSVSDWRVIVAVACVARLLVVFGLPHEQVSDATMYHRLAVMLASGEGYLRNGIPSAWWPVGYPAFLAAVYFIAGPWPIAGEIANVILGCCSVALLFQLVSRFDRSVAAVAAWGLALMPSHVIAAGLLTTETLATMLWLAGVFLVFPPASTRRAITGGVVFGLGALVRPVLLLFPAAWLAAGVAVAGWRLSIRTSLLLATAMALTLLPWTARNWYVFGQPVLVSTNGGFILWAGNNPLASGNYRLANGEHSFLYALHDPQVDRSASEVEQDEAYRKRAWAFIKNEPWHAARLAGRKLWITWATDNDAVSWLLDGLRLGSPWNRLLYVTLHGAALISYWFWILLALGAMLRNLPRNAWLLLVPVVFVAAVHTVFFGDDRFKVPVMPYVIALGAFTLTRIMRVVMTRST